MTDIFLNMLSFAQIHTKILERITSTDTLPDNDTDELLQVVDKAASEAVDWTNALTRTSPKVTIDKCLALKEQGTKALQAKKLQEALVFYTKFIRLCHRLPCQDGRLKLVGQGYLSRSMVFYRYV